MTADAPLSIKIALIDDDANITASVSMRLRAEGYEVITYPDGLAGYEGLRLETPDLAVLDIKMPKMTGLELLSKLRTDGNTLPIIMLTSKDDELDQLEGFEAGADDYITKPFSQELLLARIHALLTRAQQSSTAGGSEDNTAEREEQIIRRGSLELDDARHLCTWKDNSVALTVTEYLLIKTLALRPGIVKSRDQLIDAAMGDHIFVDDRTIDSHIKRIRKKFRKIDPDFDQIETIYGVGYKYDE